MQEISQLLGATTVVTGVGLMQKKQGILLHSSLSRILEIQNMNIDARKDRIVEHISAILFQKLMMQKIKTCIIVNRF